MATAVELVPDAEYIEADLNYIVDDGITPVRYVDWPEEAHKGHEPTYEKHRTKILNGRRANETFTLPSHGFEFLNSPTAVKNFYDEDEIRRVYYPETAALIQARSGASRVIVFDHTVRTNNKADQAERWIRDSVKMVHNDYTERSAPKRLRDILPGDEAEAALKRRFAIIQTWRSVAPRVERDPLAMCDGRTIPEVGFIRNERRYRDRTAETYHISYHPDHRWFWFPYMTRDEVLVFKVFDTDPSAGTRFTAHTAFDDPNTAPDAAFRESIEMRAFALF